MLFNIFQLLESMGITDNLLCLIRAKWLNSFDFLILSRVTGLDNLNHPAKPRWNLDEKAPFLKGAGVQL